jgi:hypothetical protein
MEKFYDTKDILYEWKNHWASFLYKVILITDLTWLSIYGAEFIVGSLPMAGIVLNNTL